MTGYLAIDFGGTRTRAAWYDHNMKQILRKETPTRATDPKSAILHRIATLAHSIIPPSEQPLAIGIAAPGPLDAQAGVILHAETLPGWHNVPLVQIIRQAFDGVPVFMQNDGNLGALAEGTVGAGRGHDPMVYLTLSTGIGGGALIQGQLFTGGGGLAIEPGHQVFRLPDGTVKKLEALASGTALGRIATARLANDPQITSSLRQQADIQGQTVGKAAQQGDAFALQLVQEAAEWLGLGLINVLHFFNPQVIVLGGSMTQLGDLLLEPMRAVIEEQVMTDGFLQPDLIRLAALGDDVCLVGAAHLAAYEHQKRG